MSKLTIKSLSPEESEAVLIGKCCDLEEKLAACDLELKKTQDERDAGQRLLCRITQQSIKDVRTAVAEEQKQVKAR